MSIHFNLSNKNVIITGANGDIGSKITLKFLEAGANCICLDKNFRNLKKVGILKKYKNKVSFLEIDFEITNFSKILLKKMKKNILIDVLINNAGYSASKNFLKYNYEEWKKTLRINLETPFLLSQLLSKKFMKPGSSIINITSLAAEQGFPNNVAYVASKGGLKQLTKAMAIDLSQKKIRVNSIGPGYVKTKMTKKSWLDKKKRNNRSDRIILNRWANPLDIANACLFLGSSFSEYINGQEIYVDGGWLSKGLKNDK